MTSGAQPARQLAAAVHTAATLHRSQRRENFPVALRLLPSRLRCDLLAVYGVARTVDDLGDEASGDRGDLLDGFEADLRRVWTDGRPALAVNRELVATVGEHDLPIDPFLDLVAANRLDQTRTCYATWDELRHYCSLSADPVGRIVLGVLDAATPTRVAWSDDVCTALQLLEHCQDVAEDLRRGRCYLPAADRRSFGVSDADLGAATTGPALQRLLAFEVERACDLLRSGPPLVDSLRGAGRVAVAAFVGGGVATAAALRRAGFEVLSRPPRPRRSDIARHAIRLLGPRG